MPRELTDYVDESAEPTDPGALASQHQTPSFQRMQSLLETYEQRFPDETFVEISLALVGETTINETISDARDALTDDEPELTDEQRSLIETDIELLSFLEDHQIKSVEMRQYKSSVDAADVNERAVDGDAMDLAAHAKSVMNTLQGKAYDVGTKTVFVYNIEPQSPNSVFSVKIGRWKGYLGVDIFDEDIDSHLENKFFGENWYTPERLRHDIETYR